MWRLGAVAAGLGPQLEGHPVRNQEKLGRDAYLVSEDCTYHIYTPYVFGTGTILAVRSLWMDSKAAVPLDYNNTGSFKYVM